MSGKPLQSISRRILEAVLYYSKRGFTGKIEIETVSKQKVSLYLNLGFLAWVSDGFKCEKRCKRYLKQLGLSSEVVQGILDIEKQAQPLAFKEQDSLVAREYDVLVNLAKRDLLSKTQVQTLIYNFGQEILFDLIQKAQAKGVQSYYDQSLTDSPYPLQELRTQQ